MANPVVGASTTLHVPAVRGDGANLGIVGTAQDGWAVSGESKKQVGVRGICEDGWGVSGDSKTQIGVRGYCEPGWGVAGESKAGLGVRGVCVSGAGVYGGSQTADGVFGTSQNGRGVVGVAKVATGVEGNSTSGAGVFGSSQTGIGVHGKGGTTGARAGLFEGNVDITGNLTVHGISSQSWLQRISQLEQEIADLRRKLSSGGSPGGGTVPSSRPAITVAREGVGQGALFVIQGSGFTANKPVTVRVVDEQFASLSFQQSADATGKLALRQRIPCISGKTLHFSATDSRSDSTDITGVLWSNTFTTNCP